MSFSQDIALANRNGVSYLKSQDEEAPPNLSHLQPTLQNPFPPDSPRHFGRHKFFFWYKGEPLFSIGPHFPLFVLSWIGLEAVGVVVYLQLQQLGFESFKGVVIAAIAWEGFTFLLAALLNPGLVTEEERKNPAIDENTQLRNTCSTCSVIKDAKTSHCPYCDICIKGYDHHCPWIGKCIGKGNVVAFYIFILSTVVYFVVLISVVTPR